MSTKSKGTRILRTIFNTLSCTMLISMKETVAWTGAGPFEISVHAMSWLWFTIFLLLKLENVWDISYHHVFIPPFVAIGTHFFFLIILVTKFIIQEPKKYVIYITLLLLILPLLAMLLFAEVEISRYLESGDENDLDGFIVAMSILLSILFFSIFVMFRTTTSNDD